MELLLIAIYVALCMAVFRIFRIPVNQWSLSTAALIGVFGIFLLLLGMSYNHPFTTNARIYYAVTPIFPTVKGRVIEAPAESNTPLKEGTCCSVSIQNRTNTLLTRRKRSSRKRSRRSLS